MYSKAALHEARGFEHLRNGKLRSAKAHFAHARTLAFGASVEDPYEHTAKQILSQAAASDPSPLRDLREVQRGIQLFTQELRNKFSGSPPFYQQQGPGLFFLEQSLLQN